MNYFQKFFQSSTTKLSAELGDVATAHVASPFDTAVTAVCATPNEARRVIKTIDGQKLVLCADDVKYLEVIDNMFANLKALNNDVTSSGGEPFIIIPISIDSSTMLKIIEWSRAAKKFQESKLDFQKFFPELSVKECLQILEASLFLETAGLAKCAGKWLAAKLEGKSTGEMARVLGVANVGLTAPNQEMRVQFSLVTSEVGPPYID